MVKKQVKKSVSKEQSVQKNLKEVHAEWDDALRKDVYGSAPEEQHFKIVNGQRAKDLKELLQVMQQMDEQVFQHHVNETKNDFSTWINDVFKNEQLAGEVRKARTRMEAEVTLQRFVNHRLERLSRKLFYPKRM